MVEVALLLLLAPQKPDPADAAPKTRMEDGRLVYQLGETKFAFRLSKGAWRDLEDGVYLSGTRLVSVATGRSVRFEDAIEAQSRAVGGLMKAIEETCPRPGQCRMSPDAWKRFERYAWMDAKAGEFKLMLRIGSGRFSVARKGPQDYSSALLKGLAAGGRAVAADRAKP